MNFRCRPSFFSLLAFILLFVSSCDRTGFKRGIRQMLSESVMIPVSLERIQADTIAPCILDARAKCVLYIDSTECSSCRIGHLPQYMGVYNLLQDKSTDFLVIISPKTKERERVIGQVQTTMEFPVYLDDESELLTLNPWIPEDFRLHCFLTDREGRVIFVGDPTWGERTWTLFVRALEKI